MPPAERTITPPRYLSQQSDDDTEMMHYIYIDAMIFRHMP